MLWDKKSYICESLTFVYLFFPKNSTTDSRRSSITLEWLVMDSCPTPHWIAFLMLYWLVCNINPLISIFYIWFFEKIFSKSIGEIYIKNRSVTVKSITLQHFQFKKFQDEIMESAHYPPPPPPLRKRPKNSPDPINLSDYNWTRTHNH